MNINIRSTSGFMFSILFFFRYTKLIVNTVSWRLAKPYRSVAQPSYQPSDVSVIIPTANPNGEDFRETVRSTLISGAAKVIVVTFGEENTTGAYCSCLGLEYLERLQIIDNGVGNKRMQMCRGIDEVQTAITVFCDDHVFWPRGFLASILAPFEDHRIGGVGMHKRVQRVRPSFWRPNLPNFFGCIYLERHNMEILATNRIDGGVFILSSRTAAYRTNILKDANFQRSFTNEYIESPFGRIGPLNADDDNFIMRWLTDYDWDIWIQNGPEALMETTINNPWTTFTRQLLRWVRTTWRSNPRSLRQKKIYRTQPWSMYATNISLFINFALLWDPLLLISLQNATAGLPNRKLLTTVMIVWILSSKVVKLVPYLLRNPTDIVLLPLYFAFAYAHSLLKLYALATFSDISWGSRSDVDENQRTR
ncbi:uncharacterized protein PV09_04473 [Verruconis gallopava]|uniref:Glycosyltransferase 2-like domain-containing protein n=1 Tax=Verruconis gallopava TaxID=253628 RepID=A0A0D2AE53_9PEZI|nr:uncharacterized protein PV09_04473 [Verruconis gallopava]KIW04745.1 hypothetical protein PV09_04473 [Verruconis gallopava]